MLTTIALMASTSLAAPPQTAISLKGQFDNAPVLTDGTSARVVALPPESWRQSAPGVALQTAVRDAWSAHATTLRACLGDHTGQDAVRTTAYPDGGLSLSGGRAAQNEEAWACIADEVPDLAVGAHDWPDPIAFTLDVRPVGRKKASIDVAFVSITPAVSRDALDEVVRRHINQIRYCYQRELTKDTTLGGDIVIRFRIDKDGAPQEVDTERSTLDNDAVTSCIQGRFAKMTFPAPAGGGSVVVSYPFRFTPGP